MSIELHVLFSGKLPGKAALARTLKQLGFPFTIGADVGSLETHRGFMSMRLRREETGVEFDTFNGRTDVEDITAGHDIDPRFDRSANFRWGGDEMEMLAGLCTAAALAKLVDGVVLDDEEDRLLTPDEAAASAKQYLESHLGKAEQPGGTRPADLKRYLAPLLELRSDLVLVGRMLLIRPARHLLRGAFFEPSPSDKYRLYVHEFVHPLYCYVGPFTYGARIHDSLWEVWQPHFGSLLIDRLADDIFSWAGKVTTLEDFAALPFESGWFDKTQVITRFLAGGREHAAAYVRKVEQYDEEFAQTKLSVAKQLDDLPRDVGSVCAGAHAREAETVKKLKLERIWEPSPFPVELPPGERVARTAEPLFRVTPWIPRPESLIAEAPENPGEILYAKQCFHRDGRIVLAAPLTPQAAAERHRAHEHYIMAVRLRGGLMLISRNLGDRREPPLFGRPREPREWLDAALHGRKHLVSGTFFQHGTRRYDVFRLEVSKRSNYRFVWSCQIDIARREVVLRTPRKGAGRDNRRKKPLTAAVRRLARFRPPAFGEYAGLADRMRSLLRITGFGSLE